MARVVSVVPRDGKKHMVVQTAGRFVALTFEEPNDKRKRTASSNARAAGKGKQDELRVLAEALDGLQQLLDVLLIGHAEHVEAIAAPATRNASERASKIQVRFDFRARAKFANSSRHVDEEVALDLDLSHCVAQVVQTELFHEAHATVQSGNTCARR